MQGWPFRVTGRTTRVSRWTTRVIGWTTRRGVPLDTRVVPLITRVVHRALWKVTTTGPGDQGDKTLPNRRNPSAIVSGPCEANDSRNADRSGSPTWNAEPGT